MVIFIIFMEIEDNIRPTIRNKENQKEVSLNDNEHDKQSEEDLEKFKEEVQEIIKNQDSSLILITLIDSATYDYLSKYEDLAKISDIIFQIIQTDRVRDNPDLKDNIINGFV